MVRTVRAVALPSVVVAVLAGCGAAPGLGGVPGDAGLVPGEAAAPLTAQTDPAVYYQGMRQVDGLADAPDEHLDLLAESACEALTALVRGGATAEEALNAVYRSGVEAGWPEEDATIATILMVDHRCPDVVR